MAPSLTLPSLAVDALGCFRGTGLVGWIFIGFGQKLHKGRGPPELGNSIH